MMWVERGCGANLSLSTQCSKRGGTIMGRGYIEGPVLYTLNAGGSGRRKIKCVSYIEGSCIF